MAAFIAKQMMGDQLKSVKAMGDGEKKEEGAEGEVNEEGEDPEIAEARREAEERRQDKHRKMEEERENMRQSIRDKYGIKKKEELMPVEPTDDPDMAGRLGRKKKSPAEMAAEAQAAEEAEENAIFPPAVSEFTSKISEMPGKIASEAQEKCVLQ